MTVINSLETSISLTLNEKVVILSIFCSLALHCLKSKLCPKSWQYRNTKLHEELVAKQLAKSAFDEIDESERPEQEGEAEPNQMDSEAYQLKLQQLLVEQNRRQRISTLQQELDKIEHLWQYDRPDKSIDE